MSDLSMDANASNSVDNRAETRGVRRCTNLRAMARERARQRVSGQTVEVHRFEPVVDYRERRRQRARERYASLSEDAREGVRERARQRSRQRQSRTMNTAGVGTDEDVTIPSVVSTSGSGLLEGSPASVGEQTTYRAGWYARLSEEDRENVRRRQRERYANVEAVETSSTYTSVAHWQARSQHMRSAINRTFTMCTWNKQCTYCHIPLLNVELNGFCCNKGRWLLPELPPLPGALVNLYDTPGFNHVCRKINKLFCFSVLGVDGEFVNLDFPSSVTIMGRTYHRLLPTRDNGNPIHWYIYDDSQRYSQAGLHGVPFQWIGAIGSILDRVSPFIRNLRMMGSMRMPAAYITIDGLIGSDEIAAIADVNNTADIAPRVAGFWARSEGEPTFMNILDPMYEPLQYPLFFPHGTPGWGPGNEYNFTQLQWYRARLLHEDRFIQLGRLCGEYLVDMYSRVEDARLNYFRTSAFRNRRIQYDEDYSERENDGQNDVILPSSFLGCQRWCSVQVADALALSRSKGRPTLFVTMTTNTDWPEIRAALRPGQNASDNPMAVVRCFHGRLQRLKGLLHKFFQRVSYIITVVEFQKRGLPHAHLVLRTEPDIPIECVDDIISAELPSDPTIRGQVQKFMIHRHSGRCSPRNSPCCYSYPKPVNPTTHLDSKGYVQYRRRSVDDAWVVPYNAFLLHELDCHIMVDIASTVHVFSYLYGYIYKGFDTAKFQISQESHAHEGIPLGLGQQRAQTTQETRVGGEHTNLDAGQGFEHTSRGHTSGAGQRNEIQEYIKARYLSAMEAFWRIMSYEITHKTPAVKCLPLHLLRPNTRSLLDRYFLRPLDRVFDTLTYIQYYEQYTLTTYNPSLLSESGSYLEQEQHGFTRNVVKKRTRQPLVCRIRLLLPRVGEAFYLRQILLHRPARTWDELKIVNDQPYETYQQAAEAEGLLAAHNEAKLVMEEAVSLSLGPSQLRFLFAMLLLDQGPATELWTTFQVPMSLDLLDEYPNDDVIAFNESLHLVNNILLQHGTNIMAFGIQLRHRIGRDVMHELEKFSDHTSYLNSALEMSSKMNDNQLELYHFIRQWLESPRSTQPIFVDGKAGTGKTFLLKCICFHMRGHRCIVLPCGTTALAARLYAGGRTAHSLFQIPVLENNAGLHSMLENDSGVAQLIIEARVIIWDEFPMANKAVIESVNHLLQRLCGNNLPFGGKHFIAAGDFRQVAPVVKGGGRIAAFNASIKSSSLWRAFRVLRLHQPIRNVGDPELMRFVDNIGENWEQTTVPLDLFNITIADTAEFLYPPEILCNPAECDKRVFLAPINKHVDEFNGRILNIVSNQEKAYYSHDHITEQEEVIHDHPYATSDFLNNFTHSGIPNHELRLKVGAICHVMKRLDMEKGLVKNARVVIESMHSKFVMVRVLGDPDGNTYPISRTDFFYQPENRPWTIHRRQLPLRLSYSTTFNSCQGLTLDRVVIDLRTNVFAHGQLYTAFTRVRNRQDVLILLSPENTTRSTVNVVYKELL